ncbi:cache domain-containing protein [Candidatus Bipolaricaulota bacterium]
MRRNRIIGISCVLAVAMLAFFASTAMADDEAAAAVKAMVERGVIMAVVEGEEAVLAAISDPEGPFIDGDLYLFAGLVSEVIMTGHPYSPHLLDIDLSTFEDPQGNLLFANFVAVASDAGAGWSEYWWPKPGEEDVSRKLTYIMKVPGQDLYIGCGYYPED